jgi:hypothetical protein
VHISHEVVVAHRISFGYSDCVRFTITLHHPIFYAIHFLDLALLLRPERR